MKDIVMTFTLPDDFDPCTKNCQEKCPFAYLHEESDKLVWCSDDEEYRIRPGCKYYECASRCGCIFLKSNEEKEKSRIAKENYRKKLIKKCNTKCEKCIANQKNYDLVGDTEVSKCTCCTTYYKNPENQEEEKSDVEIKALISRLRYARNAYIKTLKDEENAKL